MLQRNISQNIPTSVIKLSKSSKLNPKPKSVKFKPDKVNTTLRKKNLFLRCFRK